MISRPPAPVTDATSAAALAIVAEDDVAAAWEEDKRWEPTMEKKERERLARNWDKAVERTLGWMDDDVL